ncbi:hypothetical protein QBC44DRAFT_396222 [Cladorrhinum sp. PSN332]|nr:hypothetical protein QBC44DRAFT_396222 [Cladorrhinum sp. PSN332]
MFNPLAHDPSFIPPPQPPGAENPGSIEGVMHQQAINLAAHHHESMNQGTGGPQGGIHSSNISSPPFQGGIHNSHLPSPPFQGGIHNAPNPFSEPHLQGIPHHNNRQTSAETVTTLHNFRFPEDGSNSVAVPRNRAPSNPNPTPNKHIELPPLIQTQSSTSTTKRASKTPSPGSSTRRSKKSGKSKGGGKKRQKVKALPKKGYSKLRGIASGLRKKLSKGKNRIKKPAGSLFKLRVQIDNPAEAAGKVGETTAGAMPEGTPAKEESKGWFGRKK